MTFDLEKFLKNYKPKSLTTYLAPYMKHPRLKDYTLMDRHNISDIEPSKTYIKYIYIEDADDGNFKSSHIHAGGILIGCGKFVGKKFINIEDPNEWKVMMLKFKPTPLEDDDEKQKPRILYVTMSNYYIFYKKFQNGMRDFMKNIDVELIDSKGNKLKK